MDGNIITPERSSRRRRGISGSTLKLIAIFTMLIDHIGASILLRELIARGMNNLDENDMQAIKEFFNKNMELYTTYTAMRLVGRIAFPIFCFLLIQGFLHTHNQWLYARRLAVFALLSEIPFDLAFEGRLYYMGHQNVFFTLLIGLLVMIGFQYVKKVLQNRKIMAVFSVIGAILIGSVIANGLNNIIRTFNQSAPENVIIDLSKFGVFALAGMLSVIAIIIYVIMCKISSFQKASVRFTNLAVLFCGIFLASFLNTDYAAFGVLTIAIMYGLRNSNVRSMLGGCLTLTFMSMGEFPCLINLPLIYFYNGKRGLKLKYVFYLFYPVHLFILYLICRSMNLV